MPRIVTGLFVFEAINRLTGESKKFEMHNTSRLTAYDQLRKEEGAIWEIEWS